MFTADILGVRCNLSGAQNDRLIVLNRDNGEASLLGFEHSLTTREPGRVEFMVLLESSGFVPCAFVDFDSLAVLACGSAV